MFSRVIELVLELLAPCDGFRMPCDGPIRSKPCSTVQRCTVHRIIIHGKNMRESYSALAGEVPGHDNLWAKRLLQLHMSTPYSVCVLVWQQASTKGVRYHPGAVHSTESVLWAPTTTRQSQLVTLQGHKLHTASGVISTFLELFVLRKQLGCIQVVHRAEVHELQGDTWSQEKAELYTSFAHSQST
jgi:hypothetical protein